MARFVQTEDAAVSTLRDTLRTPSQLIPVDTIRIASYNVRNLFGPTAKDPTTAAQSAALGQVIARIGADVFVFAEVENVAAIKSVFQKHVNPKLDSADRYDAFVCIGGNDRRGINVALVTRLSVRGATTFRDREFDGTVSPTSTRGKAAKFSRDLLGVHIQPTPDARTSFLYFAAHLKSKIGGPVADRKRQLEAEEIVDIFTRPPFGCDPFIDQRMLLSGDFNAEADGSEIATLKKSRLVDVFEKVADNHTYPTRLPKRKYPSTRLDYLFASAALAPKISDCCVDRRSPADEASDHYPIAATLRVI